MSTNSSSSTTPVESSKVDEELGKTIAGRFDLGYLEGLEENVDKECVAAEIVVGGDIFTSKKQYLQRKRKSVEECNICFHYIQKRNMKRHIELQHGSSCAHTDAVGAARRQNQGKASQGQNSQDLNHFMLKDIGEESQDQLKLIPNDATSCQSTSKRHTAALSRPTTPVINSQEIYERIQFLVSIRTPQNERSNLEEILALLNKLQAAQQQARQQAWQQAWDAANGKKCLKFMHV